MKVRPRSVFMFLLDVVELYMPMLAFLTIFVCFLIQIVSRYFFTPLMWPEELALISFLWVALLGALYAKREESMVAFSMVYDIASPRVQFLMRTLGNFLIIFFFSLSYKPSLDYVLFMSFKNSGALGIPMNIAYSCYVIFLTDIIIRYSVDLVRDVRRATKGGAK